MKVEIGAEAALFPEKEYINGIAVAVYSACVRRFLEFYWRFHFLIPIIVLATCFPKIGGFACN